MRPSVSKARPGSAPCLPCTRGEDASHRRTGAHRRAPAAACPRLLEVPTLFAKSSGDRTTSGSCPWPAPPLVHDEDSSERRLTLPPIAGTTQVRPGTGGFLNIGGRFAPLECRRGEPTIGQWIACPGSSRWRIISTRRRHWLRGARTADHTSMSGESADVIVRGLFDVNKERLEKKASESGNSSAGIRWLADP